MSSKTDSSKSLISLQSLIYVVSSGIKSGSNTIFLRLLLTKSEMYLYCTMCGICSSNFNWLMSSSRLASDLTKDMKVSWLMLMLSRLLTSMSMLIELDLKYSLDWYWGGLEESGGVEGSENKIEFKTW